MDYAQKVKLAKQACQNIDSSLSILSADTDKVKSYVYSSTKLPEMRGASIVLDELNQEGTKRVFESNGLVKECLLFNKGGSVLALVPTSLKCKIQSEIETLYLQKTHALASITVVTEPIEQSQLQTEFHKIIKRLANRLKLEKEQKREFPVYEVIPFARRCQSCGIRPANFKRETPDEVYLCKSCEDKRECGEYKETNKDSGKTRFFNKFLVFLAEDVQKEHAERILARCQKLNAKVTSLGDMSNARDLGEIGDKDGYIGVIYADGNEIGAKIETLETPEAFVEFSEKLFEITENSVYSALARYICPKPADSRCILPFEIISIGGDDVFLILPADIALQVANQLCKNFEEEAQASDVCKLKDATLSAGVVIAKENFPVYYIYDLVNQLLKNAKKKAKSNLSDIKTVLDFMVLKSQGGEVSSISDYRRQILADTKDIGGIEQKLELTFRPYLREDFEKLLAFVKKLNDKKFPKSKLYAIRESLEEGKENSILQYLYLMAKAPKDEKDLLQKDFPNTFLNSAIAPWKKEKEVTKQYVEYRTPLVDIMEIFDFITTL